MKRLTEEQRLIAEKNGISYQTLNWRLKNDWDVEEAITTKTITQQEAGKIGASKYNELLKNDRSHTWLGGGSLLMCPVTECGHIGTVITKAHCRIVHEMEREEVQALYGMPFNVKQKRVKQEEFNNE